MDTLRDSLIHSFTLRLSKNVKEETKYNFFSLFLFLLLPHEQSTRSKVCVCVFVCVSSPCVFVSLCSKVHIITKRSTQNRTDQNRTGSTRTKTTTKPPPQIPQLQIQK